jgi:class 3 adenylate cyclase/predicted ATPase
MDVAAWLRGLGLEQYASAFRENDVDGEVLSELTADDLISIGVTSVGHRRKLLASIAGLRGNSQKSNTAQAAAAEARALHSSPNADAERRQLTVMFCDLVGSTELASRLDPEDLREVISAYHHAVADTVSRFDGFVAKYMGDGVLIYFGYPRAHEDDGERAVRAGLDAIAAVRSLDVKSVKLDARVGIATGLVVVGDLIGENSAQEQSVVGETPNLAARLQALAEPNAVVIGASTRRLVGDLFEVRDLGTVEVKGISSPVPAWRVLRPSVAASRFEALRGAALTKLVGRDEEIDLLLRRWECAKAGDGQVVLLSGEAGLGKSRITVALDERVHDEQHIRLRYFCSPYHQDSALFPFIDLLRRAAGFGRDDSPASRMEKLRTVLTRVTPPEQDLALLADLMSLPAAGDQTLSNLSPQRKKELTLEALIRQLEGLAREQPVLMVFEDAHWIDPTSRELLDMTVDRVRRLPMLLIITFRPEFQPPWTGQPQVSVMALNRLDRRDRTALVEQIAGGKSLPDEIVTQIVDRADGVPLFVEELTKSVLESGLLREEGDRYVLDGALPPFAIPTSLHDSLMARLDRLASVRHVAQIGAAIGREFSYALLRPVSRLPADELEAALGRLVASGLVFERGTPPDAVYRFKHALVQDAAHGSLLRRSRQQLHARIAETLLVESPELIDSQPELLAQHYEEAGFVEKSIACWGKAGRRSAARSAMAEAVAQFHKAIDQVELLPDSPKRQLMELELYSSLGAVLFAVKGWAASETGHAYAHARVLWDQLGSPPEFLHILLGQSLHYVIRGELALAQRLDEDLTRLGRERGDSAMLVLGHLSSGRSMMFAGRFESARWHMEAGLALYDPVAHRSLVNHAATYPHVHSLSELAIVLFCLGFPDQALARRNAAVAEAQRLAHPPSLSISLALGALLLSLVGDHAAADEPIDQLLAVTTEQKFPYWGAMGTVYFGWMNVMNGKVAEGISLLRSGATAYRSTGAEAWTPYHFNLLSMACERAGRFEESLTLVEDALEITEKTGARWLAAELYRHKGQRLLRQGHTRTAEGFFRKALSIAKEQQAKIWALRAAVSLAQIHQDQGRAAEARDLLTPIYGSFTEGFATPDLTRAKALIDELAISTPAHWRA